MSEKYHITPIFNLPSIKEGGLKVNQKNGLSEPSEKLYFFDDKEVAINFGKEYYINNEVDFCLCVVYNEDITFKEKHPFGFSEYISTKNIPLEDIFSIEIFNDIYKGKCQLVLGGTGSGKTYYAINKLRKLGKDFVITVPTRQLAYEIFIDYKLDYIRTGEISLGNLSGAGVVVYENLKGLEENQDLILDEAHYLNDIQRGGELLQQIIKFTSITMLTATDTLSSEIKKLLSVKVKRLKPLSQITKEEIQLKDIELLLAENEELNILIFTKFAPTQENVEYYCDKFNIKYEKASFISANVPTSQRLQTQLDFKERKLKLVVSSNVLAQGVNLPADIVLIEYNEYDDWELIKQKIGRCGRPFLTKKGYFCLSFNPIKERKKGIERNINLQYVDSHRNIDISQGKFQQFEVPFLNEDINIEKQYKEFKYSKRLLNFLGDNKNEIENKALNFITMEQDKIIKIIENYQKFKIIKDNK